jgi:molybdate/tungstate transport system substrate-binding protein
MTRSLFFLLLPLLLCFESCVNHSRRSVKEGNTLVVFHAGSLSVPLKNLADSFIKENPGVNVQLEAAGSLTCIRKITELGRNCDILALADYQLIDVLLIPDFADWNILFATNELVIAYTPDSRRSGEINSRNWFNILSDPEVRYGRSDPDSDPCGYRTVLAMQLESMLSPDSLDWQRLLNKDVRFIRGKETDLIALLESQTIDYMFNYRSVAVQHGFEILELSDSSNLSDPHLQTWYSSASTPVRGASPGSVILQKGAPIVYGLTIPKNSVNPELAEKFIRFITDAGKGQPIIEQSGQKPILPEFSIRSGPTRIEL